MFINKVYYNIRPLIPRKLQIWIRRPHVQWKRNKYSSIWPINEKAGLQPDNWKGWPGGKKFAFILTHDVESQRGHDRCKELAKLESDLGFKSSFNFVPRRYRVSDYLRQWLKEHGFEVGIHGLYHDGKKFSSYSTFRKRAEAINNYIKDWESVGFRSPSMISNLDWIHELDIEYDSSTFDTDPFEPQSGGVNTIFPFIIRNEDKNTEYVELPYTLPQDFTLFILMKEQNLEIWKKKLDWIAEKGGMALINTHPDYMNINGLNQTDEEYPHNYYLELLKYVKEKYDNLYYHDLPKNLARYITTSAYE